jgi:hypothetical protein
LLAYGAATVIRSFVVNDRRRVFFGTLCYLTGILFLLKKVEALHGGIELYFPAFLIIFGLSFFMLFVFNIKDWHLLIPAFIFGGLGAALMLTHLGYWYTTDVLHAIGSYWPILLIIMGVSMLLRRQRQRA